MPYMKSSGVEWLEKIPTDWNIIRMTKCFKFFKGLDIKKTDLVQYGSAVISYGQVHDKLNNGYSLQKNLIRYINQSMLEIKEKSRLSNGDFVFADTSEDLDGVGNCIYIDSDGELYAGYHTLVARCIEPDVCHKYLAFLFLTDAWRSQLRRNANGTKVYSVTQRMFKFVSCLLPPIDVQLKIVAYLEQKCDDVDTIIAREQSVIEKLQEYKKAIITETIIKGLNDSVERQNQGAVWFHGVPISWTFSELRYVTRDIFDIDHWMPESRDEGIPYLMTGDLESRTSYIDFSKTKKISIEDFNRLARNKYPCHHDIIMARYASIGNCTYVDTSNQFLVSYSCLTIRPNIDEILPMFMYYYFKSYAFEEECKVYIKSNTQGNIGKDNLRRIKLVYPNIGEQALIVKYLDTKCANIDAVILKKHSLIDKLTEYKKSLIYEVVTGKKEVPHV